MIRIEVFVPFETYGDYWGTSEFRPQSLDINTDCVQLIEPDNDIADKNVKLYQMYTNVGKNYIIDEFNRMKVLNEINRLNSRMAWRDENEK